ncbi:MAG: GAF domain-containing SpoIIE family protein phosphatase [Pirellulales bacterium]
MSEPPPHAATNGDAPRNVDGLLRLLEVTKALAAEIDLHKILDTINHQVCLALDCQRASLYQYDAETDELYTSVVTELEIDEIRRPAGQGITGDVARRCKIANVSDPAADPRWNPVFDQRTGFHTHNILAAPLVSLTDHSLLGVLQLLNKRHGAFDADDELLLTAFGQHAAVAIDRARVVEELRRQQVVQASLNIAREVQRSFMPDVLPAIDGYDLATWWFPNEEVGGDYCDVVRLGDGRWGLVMADVSGHGLGPSLIMASVRAALRALMLEHWSTDELLTLLGRSLADDLRTERFITIVLAALDPTSHELHYTNAGHGPALLYSPSEDRFVSIDATGLPLGVVDDPHFETLPPLVLQPNDLLFFCTDGIVEATDPSGSQFGVPRLKELIRGNANLDCEALTTRIGDEVSRHYEGDHPPDDLTILAARRLK